MQETPLPPAPAALNEPDSDSEEDDAAEGGASSAAQPAAVEAPTSTATGKVAAPPVRAWLGPLRWLGDKAFALEG